MADFCRPFDIKCKRTTLAFWQKEYGMQRRLATLEDVAREAGVSLQTVSRVLNNPDVVSERTRDKVNHARTVLPNCWRVNLRRRLG